MNIEKGLNGRYWSNACSPHFSRPFVGRIERDGEQKRSGNVQQRHLVDEHCS